MKPPFDIPVLNEQGLEYEHVLPLPLGETYTSLLTGVLLLGTSLAPYSVVLPPPPVLPG